MTTFTDRFRVAMLPLDIAPADKQANFNAVERALTTLPAGTDLVVLPELFSTGFVDDDAAMRSLAERNTQETIDRVKAWAARCSCAIAGSFLAFTAPSLYNRGFLVEPAGEETFYDKHHLFTPSREARLMKPGLEPVPVVRFRRWNIALAVCYDLRFPAWLRNRGARYDMLVLPANWPESRGFAWKQLVSARAIENQCAVVGADRGGSDAFGTYDGMTIACNCMGERVEKTSPDSLWVVADFSKDAQDAYRSKFPALGDADEFTL